MREWRKHNKAKAKAYDQKWRAINPDKAKESDRSKGAKLYAKKRLDPEFRAAAVARVRRWVQDNPERAKENRNEVCRRRRARKLGVTIGAIDRHTIVAAANGLCGICGESLEGRYEFDHIIPLARGGGHTQDNLQLSHPRCNRRKNRMLPEEYAEVIASEVA